jgi:amino acid adenylation domain-containing protein
VPATIPERFESVAAEYPRRDALRSPDRSYTYEAARDLVHRVGHALLEGGVTPGQRALLLFGHHPASVAALIGASKAGAIAVPVSTSAPPDRREQILQDADPACIVTNSDSVDAGRELAAGRFPVWNIDDLPPARARDWPELDPGAPSFILYTSGSTGRPRGVVQSHRSVLRKVNATHDVVHFSPDDRVLMISTFAVGQGFTSMFGPLLQGATVCAFDVRRLGFPRLVRWLVDERVTVYISSASLFRSLVRSTPDLRCPDLRLVRLSSERVTPREVYEFRRLFGAHARLVVAYSSTETSTISMHLVRPDEEFPDGIVPVGVPTQGIRVSIVDEQGQFLPPGVEGEIAATSTALPLGYWGRPEQTARTYSQAADGSGERTCRTGDLGRLRADGLLEHLGRKDRRVKVRGYRVELEEIESVLSRHPSIARAAVVARTDETNDSTLVAYVEFVPGGATGFDDVRRFAATHLPEFVVPTTFVALESLPLTDGGKVAFSLLPDPSSVGSCAEGDLEFPNGTTEQLIADTWKEVLGLHTVGVHDQFLMVGGDSLRAGQIATRVTSAIGVEVLLWELLERGTIRGLAELVAEKRAAAG